MKLATILIGICFFYSCSQPTPYTIESLHWLEGNWQMITEQEDESGFEVWKINEDYSLSGLGVNMKLGDTSFTESLAIVERDSTLFYIAEVDENPQPTLFRIDEVIEKGFTCVNENHDFPKKIKYILTDEKELEVEISGDDKSYTFRFYKSK
ncbi:hypothetical protein GYB22_02895 [bacterium]|nr:hypothetical protein [bacterium]